MKTYPCSHEECEKQTTIRTYDGEENPLCFNHYMERVQEEGAES